MLWTSPAWRRAPLLLLAFPSLLLAMAIAVVTLAVASAAGPVFISSAGNEVLSEGIGGIGCPWEVPFMAGGFAPIAGATFLSNGNEVPATTLLRERESLISE